MNGFPGSDKLCTDQGGANITTGLHLQLTLEVREMK